MLKVLAIAIKSKKDSTGIKIGKAEVNLSIFVDRRPFRLYQETPISNKHLLEDGKTLQSWIGRINKKTSLLPN